MKTVKDIGEFELIDIIKERTRRADTLLGIGDDAAMIKATHKEVLTTDVLVEDVHFRQEWFSAEQVGKKAIESNVSDVAAMGGKPSHVLVSLVIPKNTPVKWVKEVYKGMRSCCRKYNIDIIGGNMAQGKQIVVSVTLLGKVKKPVLRSGARPGDLVIVSGPLGGSVAGYEALRSKKKIPKRLSKQFLEPSAQVNVAENITPYVSSMIDISDGLTQDLGHLCRESNVGAVLYQNNVPIAKEAEQVAFLLNKKAVDFALYSGEEYQLLYTIPPFNISQVPGFLVGEITKKKGVRLYANGKEKGVKGEGFRHF